MGLKEDLESLRDTLKDELAKDRIDPVAKISSTSNEDNYMRSQLQEEKIRNDSLTSKLEALNSEVSDACDLIDRLKTDLKRESGKVNELQNKLSESQKELRLVTSSSADLDTERRRRVKAETELELHRRQSKQSDNSTVANAKRVAIALACRCAELSDELAGLKGLKVAYTPAPPEIIKQIIFQEETKPVPSPVLEKPVVVKSGWDLDDDDDLFSLLN